MGARRVANLPVAGTEWIFRPVHLRETSPDLEVRVAIDHGGRAL